MVKLKASLLFAMIAALVIALAGFLRDVRLITIALRCLVGLVAACAVSYLVMFLLEAKDIVIFELSELPATEETEADGGQEAGQKDEEPSGEQAEEQVEEDSGTGDGFQPLDAKTLKHMEAPPES